LNLPTVQVSDLVVEEDDLVIGTHGRSFWVMYGIGPLRQMSQEIPQADAWLFDPADPVRGVNPTLDVYYFLEGDAEEVTLEVLDGGGSLIQAFTGSSGEEEGEEEEEDAPSFGFGSAPSPGTMAGSSRFRWNLRYPGYTDFEGRIFWAAGNMGPMAVPGTYTVRLLVDGELKGAHEFQIRMDPRIQGVTRADLQARFDLATEIRDRVSEANEAVILIREVKAQIADRAERGADADLRRAGENLSNALSVVEGEIYQVKNRSNQDPLNFPIKVNNKLAALMGVVESGEARPTDQSYTVFEYLSGILQVQLDEMNRLLDEDLAAFNAVLRESGLEMIQVGGEG
jgi:hypothetical protein